MDTPEAARNLRVRLAGGLLLLLVAAVAAQPLHSHVAVWGWIGVMGSAMLLAGQGQGLRPAPPSHPALEVLRALRLWLLLALAACLIEGAMGLWHGEGLRTMRQDGKLLTMALGLLTILSCVARLRASAGLLPLALSRPMEVDLGAALTAALGAQLLAAAVVGVAWPRAELPMSAIPWATSVALTLAVLMPLALRSRGRLRWLLMAAVVAGVVAIIASRSRSSWIVLPWILVVAVMASSRPWRALPVALAVAAAGLAAGLLYDAQQPVQVERGLRLLDLWSELRSLDAAGVSTSTGSRLALWQAAWDSLLAHPAAGIGLDGRIALVQAVVPPQEMPGVQPLVHVHQQFLNQAVDHGVPGLLAALLSAAGLVAMAVRSPAGLLRWQLTGVAVVHITGLLFNANLTHGPYAFALACTVAVAVVLHALQKGQAHE